jgi:integrase
MASLRKKGRYYYARFYDRNRSPKRKEIALRCTQKEAARRKLVRLEKGFERGEYDPWNTQQAHGSLSAQEAINRFLEFQEEQGLAARTLDTYEGILKRWMDRCPPALMLVDISADHVRQYVYDSDVASATRDKRYRHIAKFMKWAVQEGLLASDPLESVDRPRKEEKVPAYLSPQQLDQLLEYIDWHAENVTNVAGQKADLGWLRDTILIALATGLRRGELLNLRWADIDLDHGRLHVRNRAEFKTKSGSERVVPVRGPALDTLLRMANERDYQEDDPVILDRRGKPVKPDRLTKRFKDMVRGAKLQNRERLSLHSLRHSCGTWLASNNVSESIIQKVLGHASTQTTQIYIQIANDAVEDAMEQAFGN